MSERDIATIRRFNRSYTQRIGALDESFLGSGQPLGPSRLLFEIGPDGAGVRELRERLGLDSGYLSRLLRRLEADRLVEVRPDPEDGRRRRAVLTTAGGRARSRLDARSDELVRGLVAPLSESQRRRLVEALASADLLVRAATVRMERVDPSGAPARAAVSAYFDEIDRRFPGGFDPGDGLDSMAEAMTPPGGSFLLAVSDGEPVACGGVQPLDAGVGEIKRMWVHGEWRGAGLGSRLLARLELEAAELGHRTVRLDTNDTLTEAIAMYERAGYRSIDRYNDNPYARRWFEKDLPGAADGAATEPPT